MINLSQYINEKLVVNKNYNSNFCFDNLDDLISEYMPTKQISNFYDDLDAYFDYHYNEINELIYNFEKKYGINNDLKQYIRIDKVNEIIKEWDSIKKHKNIDDHVITVYDKNDKTITYIKTNTYEIIVYVEDDDYFHSVYVRKQ